ncbi:MULTISPECIES: AMP-binding protein [Cryobacterium]|uniref:AMP-binding protein n=1 Tax=Cryobacterium TaxID=69578 RepID=UPI00141ADCDB|nr:MULTISPECIES: AMP-binding protein [Cryobacterium]
MTRPLTVLPVGDPLALMSPLRLALANTGDAVLPVPGHGPAPALAGLARVPRQVSVVIETSGSTDVPKRVMLSTDALLSSAAASSAYLGGAGQWLLALPVHYIAGVQVLVRSIVANTTPVVLPGGHFDPAGFTDWAERLTEPLRFTALVPVQLARLVEAAGADRRLLAVLRRFQGILVGGQALPPELAERSFGLDLRVVATYGSSETAGGCVYNGTPIGNTEVRAVDGQLEIAGSVLAEGYVGDLARTGDRFIEMHGERWYRTRDLGEVDAVTGFVRVLGRADNVIISGGEKVSLDAVERVVRSLPGLGDAVVVGRPDRQWGQVPVLVLPGVASVADDTAVILGRIGEAVASALGKAARPVRLVRVAAIPQLSTGKPDLRALARMLADL